MLCVTYISIGLEEKKYNKQMQCVCLNLILDFFKKVITSFFLKVGEM